MSQKCPVCKTRLWSDPMLVRSKLRCPRCGAEFKPTVPWHYVRILLILLIVLALVLTFIVSQGNLPLLVLFAIVGLLLWFAPRLIHFEPVGPELNPSEGVLDPQDWRNASRRSKSGREAGRGRGEMEIQVGSVGCCYSRSSSDAGRLVLSKLLRRSMT